ncbi:acyl-CoA dehydrogenase [Ponticaulis sp.]|uniref:acyl-CoA dehydrogenase n=1 Tax=Ponticaulis sp. TaxID=2020902 RepID=UPI000B68E780|nr:acyl-CoA dehydrogenase [Ponticaulis sp.]MAI91248.1 acyl-CoA dehydrogenase [Ponticaulis sp.]OUX98559.1 MAG: acyl-CoA dehydrogenase [Hyphomonadaceae bacterium TMED5]|tara:strand:- start:31145 stop:32908 length:1764 start_codon:yes stop_codon:yes gene_type:complete
MITAKTLEDVISTLSHVTRIDEFSATSSFPEFDQELVRPIIEEAGRLASEVLAPLNRTGDEHGAKLVDGDVIAAPGFKEAYDAFREGGWMSLAFPEEYSGQGLPQTMALPVMELIQAANMSFSLCPMLSFGAIEALMAHGTDEQKTTYLPKLVSGEWTGTMNLTEPQAGSDVGALKTKAEPIGDGSYAITGQKIFITWGDHDLTDNIIHLVLARLPDAPAGSKGISLFLCPKFLLDDAGEPGERNGARCIGLEQKMGIHASPTCVMEFDGAKGWMIGEPNKGLAAMFTMMNSARLQVGIQGVAQSEAAYQAARQYADERLQGRRPGEAGAAAIVRHADVQNMLLNMRAKTLTARAICYECARAGDVAHTSNDDAAKTQAKWREEILTPIAKAWSTDIGVEMASLGVQVHGGMGFMGETLAAQIYRDARIAPIYEGTNGIQAMDLVSRKLPMAGGKAIASMLDEYIRTAEELKASADDSLKHVGKKLGAAIGILRQASDWLSANGPDGADASMFGATAYLDMFGKVAGVHYLARGAMHAQSAGSNSAGELTDLALFLSEFDLSLVEGLLDRVRLGETLSYNRRMELLS